MLKVCRSRNENLVRSAAVLAPVSGVGSDSRFLYVPPEALRAWPAQELPLAHPFRTLHTLLTELHNGVFLEDRGSATFFLYHDPGDGVIAFHSGGGQLWYNAAADCKAGDARARSEFWYHVVCHELAHHFVREHDSEFSQYVGKITLEYSRSFFELQQRLRTW